MKRSNHCDEVLLISATDISHREDPTSKRKANIFTKGQAENVYKLSYAKLRLLDNNSNVKPLVLWFAFSTLMSTGGSWRTAVADRSKPTMILNAAGRIIMRWLYWTMTPPIRDMSHCRSRKPACHVIQADSAASLYVPQSVTGRGNLG